MCFIVQRDWSVCILVFILAQDYIYLVFYLFVRAFLLCVFVFVCFWVGCLACSMRFPIWRTYYLVWVRRIGV